jgi:uncharacterized protein (TIGR02284 family)
MSNTMTIRELNSLIEMHFDAADIAEEAARGIAEPEIRADVEAMRVDHGDAINYLQERVRQLGGLPSTSGHAANLLREAWQKAWKDGGDIQALQALRANERVAVDALQLQFVGDDMLKMMSEEGKHEAGRTLEMEIRHFQILTDRLRSLDVAVDNDDLMGAVRNAAEHIYAALNMGGIAVESVFKWLTGVRST